MRPDDLSVWIRLRFGAQKPAAEALAISTSTLEKYLYGTQAITRQSRRIIELLNRIEGLEKENASLAATIVDMARSKIAE
jgi:hypothetical protein